MEAGADNGRFLYVFLICSFRKNIIVLLENMCGRIRRMSKQTMTTTSQEERQKQAQ